MDGSDGMDYGVPGYGLGAITISPERKAGALRFIFDRIASSQPQTTVSPTSRRAPVIPTVTPQAPPLARPRKRRTRYALPPTEEEVPARVPALPALPPSPRPPAPRTEPMTMPPTFFPPILIDPVPRRKPEGGARKPAPDLTRPGAPYVPPASQPVGVRPLVPPQGPLARGDSSVREGGEIPSPVMAPDMGKILPLLAIGALAFFMLQGRR